MVTRPSILYGQNFLRRATVAERLVELAEPDRSEVCVDIGAGNGIITQACLSTGHRVMAVEIDDRLAENLRGRFGDNPRFELVHQDLTTAPLPPKPYSVAANPPFNQSTAILRRWILDGRFQSAAIVAQHEFGRKVAGHYGATKMSVAVAPFRTIDIPELISSDLFRPRPKVPVGIVRIKRVEEPEIPWARRQDYWLLVNYLFERGQRTLGEVLKPLRMAGLPRQLRHMSIRDLTLDDMVNLYETAAGCPRVWDRLHAFDRGLPEIRRPNFGDHKVTALRHNENAQDSREFAQSSRQDGALQHSGQRVRRARPVRKRS